MANHEVLLEINDLQTHFHLHEGVVKAVDGATFVIRRSRTTGIVGESGCGKSVTARSILQILDRGGRIVGGEIKYFRDRGGRLSTASEIIDLAQLAPGSQEMRDIRGGEIAMIFQEPMTSFSPVHTVGFQIREAMLLHQDLTKAAAREQAIELLRRVGIPRPELRIDNYPHELSGGMRQRAMIAMALSCRPRLLIADEPTTAVDVTIQAQILDLLRELQQEYGMAIMLITHDLGVIADMADDVVVMYLGTVVEQAPVDAVFHDPKHPYLQCLLRSIPRLGPKSSEDLATIVGSVPPPYDRPGGCLFHPRCPCFMPGKCDVQRSELVSIGENHKVRCLQFGGE